MLPTETAVTQQNPILRTLRACAIFFLVVHGFSLLFSFALPMALILNLILVGLAITILVSHNKIAAVLLLAVIVFWGLFIAWGYIQVVLASGYGSNDLGSIVLLVIEIVVAIKLIRATSKLSR